MVVYLIGFMGSGKSTIGKKLSNRLNMKFIDLDSAIESLEERSVNEIFSVEGEEYFRKIESAFLRSVENVEGTVISCGGGTPCFNDNMAYMNNTGITVYLKMSAAALISRLKHSKKERPLLSQFANNEMIEYVSTTLKNREEWYNMAKIVVDGLDPDLTQLQDLLQAQDPYNP